MTPGQRSRNLFDPTSAKPYKLSRSRLENFLKCPRCFYLDRRLGVDQPEGYPFNLNIAVDLLLKKEFDRYRASRLPHPIMKEHGINAVPSPNENMNLWRENFKGIQVLHTPTNFLIQGAIDDLWETPDGELIVVDYKATSSDKEVSLDSEWKGGWKRQMEIYQWMLRQLGSKVSDSGYFVSANGRRDQDGFNGQLLFHVTLLPYQGDASWVEGKIIEARDCLIGSEIPDANPECSYCAYRNAARAMELKQGRLGDELKVVDASGGQGVLRGI